MHIHTYLRFKADYPIPEAGQSGAGEIASTLAAGLRAKGFSPSEPKDQEYAHFLRCASGPHDYEIMVAFDFVEGHTWEISCPPVLGFLSRLFGKTEEKELSALTVAIHDAMHSNPRVNEMSWYPSVRKQIAWLIKTNPGFITISLHSTRVACSVCIISVIGRARVLTTLR